MNASFVCSHQGAVHAASADISSDSPVYMWFNPKKIATKGFIVLNASEGCREPQEKVRRVFTKIFGIRKLKSQSL